MKLKIFTTGLVLTLLSCGNSNPENEIKEKGGCPLGFDGGHKKEQISRSKTNDQWWPNRLNLEICFGDDKDVLSRFHHIAKKFNPDQIVRITGDCPLIDAKIVDKVISLYKKSNVDYCSNVYPPTFPDGSNLVSIKASTYSSSGTPYCNPKEIAIAKLFIIAFTNSPSLLVSINISPILPSLYSPV